MSFEGPFIVDGRRVRERAPRAPAVLLSVVLAGLVLVGQEQGMVCAADAREVEEP